MLFNDQNVPLICLSPIDRDVIDSCVPYSEYTANGDLRCMNSGQGRRRMGAAGACAPTFKSGGGAQVGFSPPPLDRPCVLILLFFFHIL